MTQYRKKEGGQRRTPLGGWYLLFSFCALIASMPLHGMAASFSGFDDQRSIESAHLEREVSRNWVVGSIENGAEFALWDVSMKSCDDSTILLGSSSEFIFVAALSGCIRLPDGQMIRPAQMAAWLPYGTSQFSVSEFSAEALDASFKAAGREDMSELLAPILRKQKTLLFWGMLRPTTINVACPLKKEVEALRKSYLNQPQVIAARRKSATASELAQQVAQSFLAAIAKADAKTAAQFLTPRLFKDAAKEDRFDESRSAFAKELLKEPWASMLDDQSIEVKDNNALEWTVKGRGNNGATFLLKLEVFDSCIFVTSLAPSSS